MSPQPAGPCPSSKQREGRHSPKDNGLPRVGATYTNSDSKRNRYGRRSWRMRTPNRHVKWYPMVPIDHSRPNLAGLSHAGNKRDHNEDSIGIDAQLGLAVLADGMGGYQGGQFAAALAVKVVIEEVRVRYACAAKELAPGAPDDWYRSVLRTAFDKANGIIYHVARRKPQWSSMGTTLIAVLFHDARVTI
nr:protein phosphatase 2C domain-containing protein [Gammaproteobacteria bacterium]